MTCGSVHCMAVQLSEELDSCSLRRQAKGNQAGRDDECIAPNVPQRGKMNQPSVLPPSFQQLTLQQIMLGLCLSYLPNHARIATIAELCYLYILGSVCAGAGGVGVVR